MKFESFWNPIQRPWIFPPTPAATPYKRPLDTHSKNSCGHTALLVFEIQFSFLFFRSTFSANDEKFQALLTYSWIRFLIKFSTFVLYPLFVGYVGSFSLTAMKERNMKEHLNSIPFSTLKFFSEYSSARSFSLALQESGGVRMSHFDIRKMYLKKMID